MGMHPDALAAVTRYYSVIVHEGTSSLELIIDVLARSYVDAVREAQRRGYTLANREYILTR